MHEGQFECGARVWAKTAHATPTLKPSHFFRIFFHRMFDFQKLEVYRISKTFHKDVGSFLKINSVDRYAKDQLLRASMSVMLNIAEGSGRFSMADKRSFYIIARSSVFEGLSCGLNNAPDFFKKPLYGTLRDNEKVEQLTAF